METKAKGQLKLLTGNRAAAWAVKLCKPDVVAAYPITPQSELVIDLERFYANAELDAEIVPVEGENSAMGTVVGASQVGARVFTASSSWGLEYMYDIFLHAGGRRLPIVMVNVNREPTQTGALARGRQDMMLARDTGWVQIECQNCQEIFDTIIAAYRLAEDPDILLPVLISYDGWYLSYLSERVEIATQEDVDLFLAPVTGVGRLKTIPGYLGEPTWAHGYGEPAKPADPAGPPDKMEGRLKRELAVQRVKDKLDDIAEEFEGIFGHPFISQIEEYRADDAEIILIAMGGEAMTARMVINKKREEGMKVGLVRIKMFRPFPAEKLAKVLKGKKAVGVLEQGLCCGWNCGFLWMELKAVLYDERTYIPMPNFLVGMSGEDITLDKIERAVDITYQASQGKPYSEVTWLSMPYLYE